VWLDPAKAGDALLLADRPPSAVVLLDGVFDEVPAIRHKELLVLMASGAQVYGASSMGALRAAELHPFGMIGVGRIFTAYAEGRLLGDDEVALAHAPAELDWRPLSEPLVNVRATLQSAVRRRILARPAARAALDIARGQFFRERTWESILAEARESRAMTTDDLAALEVWLAHGKVDLKLRDALECLDLALRAKPPFRRAEAPPATMFTAALADQLRISPAGQAPAEPAGRPRGSGGDLLRAAEDCGCPPT
jgi:hypothetical protein